jgi:hypothetical protein
MFPNKSTFKGYRILPSIIWVLSKLGQSPGNFRCFVLVCCNIG